MRFSAEAFVCWWHFFGSIALLPTSRKSCSKKLLGLNLGFRLRKCCDGSMKRTTLMDYITPSTTIAPNVACFQVIYQFPSLQASFSRSQVVCWNPRTTCPNTTRCSTWIWVLPWLRRLSALQACFSADWLSCERKTAQYVTAYAGVDIGSLQPGKASAICNFRQAIPFCLPEPAKRFFWIFYQQ